MKFTILQMPQRSPEWFLARAGRVTGSKAAAVMAKIKTREAAARRDLRATMVAEILTNSSQENGYTNEIMQRGIDMEPIARMAYEARSGLLVRETGFLAVDGMRVGCSLDGDIDDFSGIWECKCPTTATHLRYLDEDELPSEYKWQIIHNLLVSKAQWADFTSFDDRLPENLQLWTKRVFAKDLPLAEYETELHKFLVEVDAVVDWLRMKFLTKETENAPDNQRSSDASLLVENAHSCQTSGGSIDVE